jgi:diguanylate cyclase (GGDEF)-like protein/PAS domain S-box-containing protein
MSPSYPKIDDAWILNALMENASESIYIKDLQCRLLRVSRKMANDLGFEDDSAIIGKKDVDLFGSKFGQKTMDDDTQVMKSGQPVFGMIESYINKQGIVNWTSTTKLPLRDDSGAVVGLLGITREINELKNSEQDYAHLATHDQLTSLPNRFLLMDRITQSLLKARRANTEFAVLFLDLNEFKLVNDKYGHDKGDQILKDIAQVLLSCLRESDMVARYGGDEFVILLEELKRVEDSVVVARKLTKIVQDHFRGTGPMISLSIGISIYPQHGEDVESLLRIADHAMYEAKLNHNAWKLAVS